MDKSKTSLTIHLYRKDEALASIRWCILSRNHTEAIFWGLELYDSNMEAEAIQMLATTWVTCIGSFVLLESLSTAHSLERDRWCDLIMAFCKVQVHNSTAFYLMLRGTSPRSADWPTFAYSHSYKTLEEALEGSLRRNKLIDAWLIALYVDPKKQWIILTKIATEQGRLEALNIVQKSILRPIEKLAAAFTLISLNGSEWVSSNTAVYKSESKGPPESELYTRGSTDNVLDGRLPEELKELISEWDAENSMRKRRVFKVRYEAIVHLCERSSQPVEVSNEGEIQEDLEKTLLESSYWKGVLKPYMKSDRKREQFYDIFFGITTDIPDEWSLQDREKSHGRGLGKSEEQAFNQYVNAIAQRSVTLGIWNCDYTKISYTMNEEKISMIQLPLVISKKVFEIIA